MLEAEPKTRRERRIAARQAQILEAAQHVFSQKGYERATTREIAAAADVSEGTLYNYFDNKLDLLIGVAREYADAVTHKIAAIQADNLSDMMAQLLTDRFRSGRERRLFMLFLYEARLNPDVHRYYVQEALYRIINETEKQLQALVDAGVMRPVDPAVAARAINAAIMGFAALYEMGEHAPGERDPADFVPEKLGAQVTDIFLRGLQNPAAGDGRHGGVA
jgi:AcrR family transcriptional regulator